MAALPESGSITVERASLRYEIVGTGEPVIVLHGGPGIGYRYLMPELRDLLCEKARLIFYDQRASGKSTGADASDLLRMPVFVEDLERLRAALGIRNPMLLGHSFGGLLGMYYAIRNPRRVRGLILVDSDPASETLWTGHREYLQAKQTRTDKDAISAIQQVEGWRENPDLVARYFECVLRPFFASATMPPDFGSRFSDASPANLFATGPAVRRSLGEWDLHPLLSDVRCRSLIVAGTEGIFPAEAAERLHHGLPNSALEKLEGASHFPFIETPQAFRRAVLGFIESNWQAQLGS
jgi:proline iminopeptidase